MTTRLTGDVRIIYNEIKVLLEADDVSLLLILSAEQRADRGNIWTYNLSRAGTDRRYQHARVASGRTIAPDYHAALRQVATVIGQGYEPGTIERGLFDMLAQRADGH